jgi:hypothetical protein
MVGMIERAEGKYFDDAVLFTPEGDLHSTGFSDVWQSSLGWRGNTVSALARVRDLENGVHVEIGRPGGR